MVGKISTLSEAQIRTTISVGKCLAHRATVASAIKMVECAYVCTFITSDSH